MSIDLNQARPFASGHSATVEMWLHIGGDTLSVLQASEDAIKLNETDVVPQGDAVLEIVIDGRSHRQEIRVLDTRPRVDWVGIEDR